MCGITGLISSESIDPLKIRQMNRIIHHRGPDDEGYYVDTKVALANSRLSIIDLENGKQPMISENGIVLVFNGEIYNYIEIRRMLVDKGFKFDTNSDTEVILRLYQYMGQESFKLLNGMFAIAIYDNKKLILARDRSGIKPLYYSIVEHEGKKTLLFGSEIKCILAAGIKPQLDILGFNDFLNLRFVTKETTMFKGIKKLETGTVLVWENEEIKKEKYWNIKLVNNKNNINSIVKQLEKILPEAVKRHMIADVEVGSYLSGGIDSSTIVHYASSLTEIPLKTFTLGFGQESDETRKAKVLSEIYETDHHEMIIEDQFMRDAPEIVWHSEFPKRNLYPYYLAKMASEHVKVVLSGLGSDELFCGYTWKFKHNYTNDINENIKMYSDRISLDKILDHSDMNLWYGDNLKKDINIYEKFKDYFNYSLDPLKSVQITDFKIKMVDDFLHVDDVTSMAHSLESRTPFLDNNIIDFAFNVPVNMHLGKSGKDILRKTMKGKLPDYTLETPKHGFTISMTEEYKKQILEYSDTLLIDGNAVKQGLINKNILLNKNKLLENNNIYTIWNLLYYEVWCEIFLNEKYLSKPQKSLDKFM